MSNRVKRLATVVLLFSSFFVVDTRCGCERASAGNEQIIVTIDGPTGAGKSTTARTLADRLGWFYFASGMVWRALTHILVHEFGYTKEQLRHPRESDVRAIFDSGDLVYRYDGYVQLVWRGEDITPLLKSSFIDQHVWILWQDADTRARLRDIQRRLIERERHIVAESRDTASVVFPEAQFKFFMTASLNVRAERWRELQHKRGEVFTHNGACTFIDDRDDKEMPYASSPYDNGIEVIDTTSLNAEEVVALMFEKIRCTYVVQ